MGMAVAGLIVSLFSQRINRRLGILVSLSLLSIPTALLAIAPDLTTFTALRIAQGLCMASAFTLTLAYLGEECSAADAAGAFAAYITGNVASNLIGPRCCSFVPPPVRKLGPGLRTWLPLSQNCGQPTL
jgi:MFS family permease